MAKQVIIGSDHAGFSLKELLVSELTKSGYDVHDMGPATAESCDYPLFAQKVCERVLQQKAQGILICGTGIGMSMAANRIDGIRAALCTTEFHARATRLHNNANVLCLGERVTGPGVALELARLFLETEFEGGRHQRRIDLFDSASA
ncbi:ribose 5-phosphate isomerase B [Oleidesulfovibrio alaskensis G20]|jgi:ribose 5-phosphate isomerase B|uniref:Ribose 5-phosphate isomerase B n=1 Tax=Oleidesulfovibrio alaskensis (strain ATCC BAA-1058 / DSM 17464 / G20) TaxID=207559 RepID=Q30ZH9_OLEA2|nr:ribose 5-phosphate isomerase B [Oleidesulfovibrio alaskensis]ABB38917.1 ribose 5-phosphate isomerase B [Oleidesulfovibrio alaskensis G20]MBG0772294.1 ribose 5-phosphate isomerase B [Oleidesulfovibrio alaskensis]MBL3581054.1 ribose 5-phosphate isomerase B [Oleidesulfovibrio alaskensis]